MAILIWLTTAIVTPIKSLTIFVAMWAWRLVTSPFIAAYKSVLLTWQGVKATPHLLWKVPVSIYQQLVKFRNAVFSKIMFVKEKIEFLEEESAKWKKMFQLLKSPYSMLRAMGFTPQMATSLLVAGTAVGGGVVVNETLLAEPSFAAGDTGIYTAPSDRPIFFEKGYNTLRVDLGTTPVKNLVIENVSVGTAFTGSALPTGETTAIKVGGDSTANTYLVVGEMLFEKNKCDTLELTNINVNTLEIINNASDGQSLAPSPGTTRMQAILGGHGMAADMVTEGGLYDRIWIQAPNTGVDGKVDNLVLSNIYSKGGDCVLDRIKGGKLTISLNEVGGDSDLSTKEFEIATSVTAANITVTGNVEVTFGTTATQTFN